MREIALGCPNGVSLSVDEFEPQISAGPTTAADSLKHVPVSSVPGQRIATMWVSVQEQEGENG